MRAMKKTLNPAWSKAQVATAARAFDRWDAFFAARAAGAAPARQALSASDERIAQVRAQHEAALLGRANVVAVAEGFRMRGGKPTGERCLVVYVSRKLPAKRLAASDRLPRAIDGVPIDVVEVGTIEALTR